MVVLVAVVAAAAAAASLAGTDSLFSSRGRDLLLTVYPFTPSSDIIYVLGSDTFAKLLWISNGGD